MVKERDSTLALVAAGYERQAFWKSFKKNAQHAKEILTGVEKRRYMRLSI